MAENGSKSPIKPLPISPSHSRNSPLKDKKSLDIENSITVNYVSTLIGGDVIKNCNKIFNIK